MTQSRYQLIEKIAQGGMAEIWRAEYNGDGGFMRTLAVKRILPQWSNDPVFRKMLQDEANLLVKLQHQNIVQVFELGEDDGIFYISMEFIDGMDLKTLLHALRLKGERLEPRFCYWIISDILRALGFAHSRLDAEGFPLGIVHRDVSPQNILIARHGEVKVADFGIAKGRHRETATLVGQLKGKFSYMSPEQARGEEIDSRSDIFSTGTLFFEMLTGKKLFDGDQDLDVLHKVQEAVIPTGWERDVAPEIRAILRKCLKKHPDDRFQTAEEMLTAVSQYAARERCQIFGFEITPMLDLLFPKLQKELPPQLSSDPTHAEAPARGQRRSWHTVAAALSFAFAVTPQMEPIPVVRSVPKSQMPATAVTMTVPLPPIPAVHNTDPKVVADPVATTEKGKLTVLVRPWGYVTIPGVATHKEAPFGTSLAAGEYQVKVFHEPTSQWLTGRAQIKSGAQTTCQASFGTTPKISCR